MTNSQKDLIRTKIWREEPAPHSPHATAKAFCYGYDVFGEILGNGSWVEMLYLLFKGERPSSTEAALLERLAVALANSGPRDPAIHAAMCGGTCGSTMASSLMAALAVGAGQVGGAREVFNAMKLWQECGTDLLAWQGLSERKTTPLRSVWPDTEHIPGFEVTLEMRQPYLNQVLARLSEVSPGKLLPWLAEHIGPLEQTVSAAISLPGIAAASLTDLGFDMDQGEALYLLLRLPGAAVHALEQKTYGHKKFPFYSLDPHYELEAVRI